MAGPFFFRWSDPTDLPWAEEYAVDDEDVFSLTLTHTEGDFPVLEVVVVNPRVGLLASSRQQWAWLSYKGPEDASPRPVFFGRLVGVPRNMTGELVQLTFVARPLNYDATKEALADSLRELPWFDPIWLNEDDVGDPDRVLEGRPLIWHIDRVTHEVSVSDIIQGDSTEIEIIPEADVLYDSVAVSYSTSPAKSAVVHAEIGWNQRGSGTVDLTQQVIDAFAAITPSSVTNFDGGSVSTAGQIVTIGGDALAERWPTPGRRIGGGWTVGESSLTLIGQPPLPPTGYAQEVFNMMVKADPTTGSLSSRAQGVYQTIRDAIGRTPGYVLQVVHHAGEGDTSGASQIDFVWVPVWRMAPVFKVAWSADRARTESVDFVLTADVQPLLSDPGDEEVIYINLGPAYVDDAIPDPLGRSYFLTDRGKQSIEYLIAVARTALLARARAIDVSAQVSFEYALGLSCRQSLAIQDDRLPGGIAEGKVKGYRLSVNGDTGEMLGAVTLGCSVGRGGAVTPSDGTPVYAEDGYVSTGYQYYSGAVTVALAGDVAYSGVDGTEPDDDGMNLQNVTAASHLLDLGATGGLNTQQDRLNVNAVNPSALYLVDRVNSVTITVWAEMVPVTGGPFHTSFFPVLTDLSVPKTIDLEAE